MAHNNECELSIKEFGENAFGPDGECVAREWFLTLIYEEMGTWLFEE